MRKTSQAKKTTRRKSVLPLSKVASRRSKFNQKAQTSVKGLRGEITLRRTAGPRSKPNKSLKLKNSGGKKSLTPMESASSQVSRQGRKPQSNISKSVPSSPLRMASIKHYEAAVKLLYAQNFEKAKAAFEKIIQAYSHDKEVLERAKIHLRFCDQKVAKKPSIPRSVEDLYNVAVALMNDGKYEESLEHLNKALRSCPDCDYVLYALAATHCLAGNFEVALGNLKAAIDLKPENRFLAQHDDDFEPLVQDSRFISIVYPESATTSSP